MKKSILLLSLFLISCGKPIKGDGIQPDRILPRTLVTNIPDQMREKIKVLCYNTNNRFENSPSYMLKGNFYIGNIFKCEAEFNSCLGSGMYLHYFQEKQSCLGKRGFEEQFTLCLEDINQVATDHLIQMKLSIETQTNDLWCEEEILKIMLIKQLT